jgi:glycosyltransferase involved in cell wall biosynthesis
MARASSRGPAHMKTKILFVSYFYPPQRGIGGKRIFRWAKHLTTPQRSSLVLTTPTPPTNECDPGQATESEGVTVIRDYCPAWLWRLYYRTNEGVRAQVDPSSEPSKKARLLAALEEVVTRYYPLDPKIWFAPFAAMAALRLARREPISAAVVTAAPVSSLLVGLALGAAGVPWVADLRDPWSFNFEQQKKAPLIQWLESLVEAQVLSSAARVVFASDNTRKRYALLYPWLCHKFHTLYSGFEGAASHAAYAPSATKVLVHFGTFYGPRRLGVFIDALAAVICEQRLRPESLRLVLLGGAADADLERASALGIRELIEVRPALPYEEGLRFLQSADALLYCDPGREPYFVAGKFFDYLRASRPILALSASSEIAGLIEGHKVGLTCDPDDLAAMKAALTSLLEDPMHHFDPERLEELSAEHSAKRLATLLEELTNSRAAFV